MANEAYFIDHRSLFHKKGHNRGSLILEINTQFASA